jgi:hypothetical protein
MNAGVAAAAAAALSAGVRLSVSGPCAAESPRANSARSVSKTVQPIATTQRTFLVSLEMVQQSRYTVASAVTADGRSPSPWPGALQRAPPVKECDEPRSL